MAGKNGGMPEDLLQGKYNSSIVYVLFFLISEPHSNNVRSSSGCFLGNTYYITYQQHVSKHIVSTSNRILQYLQYLNDMA